MGIFTGIKNFVDRMDDSKEDSEVKEKYIEKILLYENLKHREIFYELINKYKNYSCFSFGENIEKQDVFMTFGIGNNEIPVFYMLQKKGVIFGNANVEVVVTDSALYCNPHTINNNRILINELPKYIIRHSIKEGIIDFYSENKKVVICIKSLVKAHLSNNTDIDLFYQLLFDLQQHLIASNCSLKKNRIQLFNWLSKEINLVIRKERVENYLLDLLYHLQQENILYTISTNLLLKFFLYRREKNRFMKVLDNLKALGQAECIDIIEKFKQDIIEYIQELNQFDCHFSDACLWNADISSIDKIDEKDINEITELKREIIQIYNANIKEMEYLAAFKYNPQIDLGVVKLSFEINNLSQNEINHFLNLYFRFKNNSMLELFQNISNGKHDCDNYFITYTDGYGLSPFHYSLILKNEEAIEYYISRFSKMPSVLGSEEQEDLEIVKNYAVVAILTKNEKYIRDIAMKSEDLAPLYKNALIIKRKIKAQTAMAKTMEFSALVAQYQIDYVGDAILDEKKDSQQCKIDRVVGGAGKINGKIELLEQELQSIENQIKSMINYIIDVSKECSANICDSTNPVNKLFLAIYSKPILLKQSLEVKRLEDFFIWYKNESELFVYEKIIDKKTIEKKSFQNSNSKNEDTNNIDKQKEYGDSWFSPEAHQDYDILVKEYHKLVTKYHPDNNGNVVIFLDIQKEKAIISEQIK